MLATHGGIGGNHKAPEAADVADFGTLGARNERLGTGSCQPLSSFGSSLFKDLDLSRRFLSSTFGTLVDGPSTEPDAIFKG
jgi:hypothetical protein